jgi:CRP-like cAMP-binding protein
LSAPLKKYLNTKLNFEEKNIEQILSYFTEKKIKRNEIVLKQGQICDAAYFVSKGCLKVSTINSNKEEVIRDFVTENCWCIELVSFKNNYPSTESIKALENSTLYSIKKNDYEKLVHEEKFFDRIYKEILETSYENSIYRVNVFYSLSPLEKMKWIKEYRPKLLKRLSKKTMSQFLKIELETYSKLVGLL